MTRRTAEKLVLGMLIWIGALATPGHSPALGQGLTPAQAVARMKLAPGFEVALFAAEPDIRQPVAMYFDERGRMWVVQYLQYPAPAGLKAVQVDQYLRTKYDAVPEPPPRGPVGADRITICEDTDGNGKADKFKDFIGGLNLATGIAIGHGGVYVMQSPYLLFYPDRNRDDAPDSDPKVVLKGFGMEDSHAFANSMQWGPDGWLYGAQGSTVTANIRGIEFQQGIWRYHPTRDLFELFAEGGGNTWGVDFDEDGNIIAGTNFGNDIALHQVQGAYYVKNFGKHGELHNPYAYGYFGHIPYKGFQGGHVTCGGIVYQGGAWPAEFRHTYVAANLLANNVYWHVLQTNGSSFKGDFGGTLLEANDPWFRPVDCLGGPDGAVYVADWHDKRATHVDPKNSWDRSNGRIYRIQKTGAPPPARFDLARKSSAELVEYLKHPNDWFNREARRLMAERRDQSILPSLQSLIKTAPKPVALEAFWAYYTTKARPHDPFLVDALKHPYPEVRAWAVRLIGDERLVHAAEAQALSTVAADERSPIVRSQLASTSARIQDDPGLALVLKLTEFSEDAQDQHIPMLLWWSLEPRLIRKREEVLRAFSSADIWKRPIVQQTLLERMARRYAVSNTAQDYDSIGQLLMAAPEPVQARQLLKGLIAGIQNRPSLPYSAPLQEAFAQLWRQQERDADLISLGYRLGHREARETALKTAADRTAAEAKRLRSFELLSAVGETEAVDILLQALGEPGANAKFQTSVLQALQRFEAPRIAGVLIELYPHASPEVRGRIRSVLASRAGWAKALLSAIEQKKIPSADLSLDQVRQMRLHQDESIDAAVSKLFGKVQPTSSQEIQSYLNEVKLLLRPSGAAGRDARGNPIAGKTVFNAVCATCHVLFNEGNSVGPDLTGADRKNLDWLLANIANPNEYIRPEYVNFEVETRDGEVVSGLLVENSPERVTLLDATNQRHSYARDQVQTLKESSLSLMPEGLLQGLSEEQITDLFSYLQLEAR